MKTDRLEHWSNVFSDWKWLNPWMPPKYIKFGVKRWLVRTVLTVAATWFFGILAALLTILVLDKGYWYPLVASGQVSLLTVLKIGWSRTLHIFGWPLLFVGSPVLAFLLCVLSIPQYLFWNRRAEKLSKELNRRPEELVADGSIWPPAPKSRG